MVMHFLQRRLAFRKAVNAPAWIERSNTEKKGCDVLMPTLTGAAGLRQAVTCVCCLFCWAAFNWLSRLSSDHIFSRCTSSDSCFAGSGTALLVNFTSQRPASHHDV